MNLDVNLDVNGGGMSIKFANGTKIDGILENEEDYTITVVSWSARPMDQEMTDGV